MQNSRDRGMSQFVQQGIPQFAKEICPKCVLGYTANCRCVPQRQAFEATAFTIGVYLVQCRGVPHFLKPQMSSKTAKVYLKTTSHHASIFNHLQKPIAYLNPWRRCTSIFSAFRAYPVWDVEAYLNIGIPLLRYS